MSKSTISLRTLAQRGIAVLIALSPLAGPAATLSVTSLDDSGPGTLRQALADANDGDTVKCSVNGIVYLFSGQLEVTRSLSIVGPGPQSLLLVGSGTRIFYIAPGLHAKISGLGITGGFSGYEVGGAIWNDHSELALQNCIVSGNTSYFDGGAIFNDGRGSGIGKLTLTDCVVSQNWANGAGGIKNDGSFGGSATMGLSNCEISDNHAWGFHGGGIWNDGYLGSARLEIYDSTVDSNSAQTVGGGIANDGYSGAVTLAVAGSVFRGNVSPNGGGISNSGEQSGNAECTVTTSTFDQNTAWWGGGGIWNNAINGSAKLTITASTLSGNVAYNFYGGGIWNDGHNGGNAVLAIQDSTLSGNAAYNNGRGGAIANDGYAGHARLVLRNSTLTLNWVNWAGNGGTLFNEGDGNGIAITDVGETILDTGNASSGGSIWNNFGAVNSAGYNLCSDDASGALTSPSDLLNTNPLLGPLQDNGGPTLTHALLRGSPAINAGNPKSTPRPNFDQRGEGFPRKVGPRVDIGAYETKPSDPR